MFYIMRLLGYVSHFKITVQTDLKQTYKNQICDLMSERSETALQKFVLVQSVCKFREECIGIKAVFSKE